MSTPNGTPSKRARTDGENEDSQPPSQPKTPSRSGRGASAAPQTPSQSALRTPNRNREFPFRILFHQAGFILSFCSIDEFI